MRKLILIAILFSFINAFNYDIQDYNSLFYVVRNSFKSLGDFLKEEFNIEGKYAKKADTSLNLISSRFNSFELDLPENADVHKKGNDIVYNLTTAFKLSVDFHYFWNLKFIPFTGVCTFDVEAKDIVYTLKISNGSIIPEFASSFNFVVKNVTNPIAVALGAKRFITSHREAMGSVFSEVISKGFSKTVKTYYVGEYGDMINTVTFPYLKGFSLMIKRTLNKIEIGKEDKELLIAHYDHTIQPPSEFAPTESADKNYLRCATFEIKELIEIMERGANAIHDIPLKEQNINSASIFHLDRTSISRIYPELSYEPSNVTAEVIFNIKSAKIVGDFSDEDKSFMFKGVTVNMSVVFSNGTKVAEATVEISGKFKPIIEVQPSTGNVFMKLKATEILPNITKKEGTLKNDYTVYNKEGFNSFIVSMMAYYFPTFGGTEAIGTGILLATGVPKSDLKLEYARNGVMIRACLYV